MVRVLTSGLPGNLVSALRARLEDALIDENHHSAELLGYLKTGDYSLLVLNDDQHLAHNCGPITQIRNEFSVDDLPVVFCLQQDSVSDLLENNDTCLDSVELAFHPLDRVELAQQIAELLNLPRGKAKAQLSQNENDLLDLIAQVWTQQKDYVLDQVSGIEEVITSLEGDRVTMDLLREGERLAHKLAGSLATYGFPEGSRIAKELEIIFSSSDQIEKKCGAELAVLINSLYNELKQDPIQRKD